MPTETFRTSIERGGREIGVECQIEWERPVPAIYDSWTGWSPAEGGTVDVCEVAEVLEILDIETEGWGLTVQLTAAECESIASAWRDAQDAKADFARDAREGREE